MKNILIQSSSLHLFHAAALSFLFLVSCSENVVGNRSNEPEKVKYKLQIDAETTYQQIDHFGASDAWSGQFIGNWPNQKKKAMADLLFSKELDGKGNPQGIGLSLWRFNLGAGSAEQVEQSGIGDSWRRAPSFMDAAGNFNRDGQSGQLWFAQAAKQRQVEYLLTFLNSPPVWLTRNGKAYATSGNQSNLAPENQGAFADFMVASLQGLKNEGLQVDYISPVNEPQWDWQDGGQEGTPFWNHEIAGIVKALDEKLTSSGLNTKIDIAEAGQIEYLYETNNRPGRSNQITEFFEPGAENYLADLSHVSNTISGHSYFTTSPFQQAVAKRQILSQAVQRIPGLKYWMSEYCILGDNDGEISGNGKDLGINPALYMARVIHNDLAVAQASAWHWWVAVSPYNYKDGLIYISKSETDGKIEESKMLWALGNYSRFIRPGYQRIAIQIIDQSEQNQDLLASAFKDPNSDQTVVVLVNSSIQKVEVNLASNLENHSGNWDAYLTDKDNDLAYIQLQSNAEILVPARSILTITTKKPL